MRRLVVISNRLPQVSSSDSPDERHRPVGGLATALGGALRKSPGSIWFGWSGTIASTDLNRPVVRRVMDGVRIVGMPMTQREAGDYYRGFCNDAVWPLFHGFLDKVKLDRKEEVVYREVAARFATALIPLLRPGDLVWVHDYHFLCLGRELRRQGFKGPIGFFLHIPFPSCDLWEVLPEPRDFLLAMIEYDLVGFQTEASMDNYAACCRRLLGARWDGRLLRAAGRSQRAGAYPIGIEPEDFLPPPERAQERGRRDGLTRVVRGRKLILGVDRLDYTKGIPERILGFEALMRESPEWRKKVSFVQIASPSRSRVSGYIEQKRLVDHLVGRVNGELAEHDWVPIRYLYRSYQQGALAEFYREADVGLVTPLRDGMNLIAKEFVAAQRPQAPGVLVLSRFAGAAEEMPEAVLVNPYIPSDTAEGIRIALKMRPEERRERHAALLRKVLANTASAWSRRFLEDLIQAAARARTIRAGHAL